MCRVYLFICFFYIIKEVIWKPLILNWIKCNCNGASAGNTTSCGGIYRVKTPFSLEVLLKALVLVTLILLNFVALWDPLNWHYLKTEAIFGWKRIPRWLLELSRMLVLFFGRLETDGIIVFLLFPLWILLFLMCIEKEIHVQMFWLT